MNGNPATFIDADGRFGSTIIVGGVAVTIVAGMVLILYLGVLMSVTIQHLRYLIESGQIQWPPSILPDPRIPAPFRDPPNSPTIPGRPPKPKAPAPAPAPRPRPVPLPLCTEPGTRDYVSYLDWVLDELNAKVNRICKNPLWHYSCKGVIPGTVKQLQAILNNLKRCLAAREERGRRCFNGGDAGYVKQRSDVSNAITGCIERIRKITLKP